uniref:Uncharacterized protein n=1 Tax=Neovison vison TaxID=452646 RepID=A0A8C7APD5_NEOVI
MGVSPAVRDDENVWLAIFASMLGVSLFLLVLLCHWEASNSRKNLTWGSIPGPQDHDLS